MGSLSCHERLIQATSFELTIWSRQALEAQKVGSDLNVVFDHTSLHESQTDVVLIGTNIETFPKLEPAWKDSTSKYSNVRFWLTFIFSKWSFASSLFAVKVLH